MRSRAICWVLVASGTALALPAARGYDEAVLDAAVRGNTSTVASIQTLYAKAKVRVTPAGQTQPSSELVAQYWREPGLVRVREESAPGFREQTIEFVAEGGRQRAVIRQPGPEPGSFGVRMLIANEWRPTIQTDVWKLALLGLPRMDNEVQPTLQLAEAVQQLKVTGVGTESGPQGRLTRVSLADDVGSCEVWLDPAVNWLCRKAVRRINRAAKQSAVRQELTVADFAEVQPGVYFPTRVTMQGYLEDRHSVSREADFTDVAINTRRQPPFPVKLPVGVPMPVADEIQGTTYAVDAEGKPTGKVDVLRYAPPPVSAARSNPNEAPPPGWFSRTSTWLFGLSLMFGVAAAALIYRRRHAGPASP